MTEPIANSLLTHDFFFLLPLPKRSSCRSSQSWDVSSVVSWLNDVGLKEHVPLFEKEMLDGPGLAYLTKVSPHS